MNQQEITRAVNKGVSVYAKAIRGRIDGVEAYIRGLDYIIDNCFSGDMLSRECQQALGRYYARTQQ